MFLKHAIKEYEFDCKARKLGVNTIQGYMRMLRYLMDYLDKEYDITQIEDVKPFHIKHFLLLKQEEGKKPQYIVGITNLQDKHFAEKVRRYLDNRKYGYDYSRKGVSITSIPETAEAKLAFLLRNSLGLDNQVDAYDFACFINAFSAIDCLLLMEISM